MIFHSKKMILIAPHLVDTALSSSYLVPTIGLPETWRNESDVVPENLLVSEERSGVPCPSRPFFSYEKSL